MMRLLRETERKITPTPQPGGEGACTILMMFVELVDTDI